jgi:CrcB protein
LPDDSFYETTIVSIRRSFFVGFSMHQTAPEDTGPIDAGDMTNPSLGNRDAAPLALPTPVIRHVAQPGRQTRMEILFLIAVGAALGAIARYMLAQWVATRFGTSFPYGTLIINLTGSFLLGLIYTVLLRVNPASAPLARAFLGIGLLGGYTTFSSFSYETSQLLFEGNILGAVINPVLSVLGGILLCILGIVLGTVVTTAR